METAEYREFLTARSVALERCSSSLLVYVQLPAIATKSFSDMIVSMPYPNINPKIPEYHVENSKKGPNSGNPNISVCSRHPPALCKF